MLLIDAPFIRVHWQREQRFQVDTPRLPTGLEEFRPEAFTRFEDGEIFTCQPFGVFSLLKLKASGIGFLAANHG